MIKEKDDLKFSVEVKKSVKTSKHKSVTPRRDKSTVAKALDE